MTIPQRFLHAPISVVEETSIAEAAREMKEHSVGSVVIADTDGRAVGMLTDRDIALAVLHKEHAPTEPVKELMTHPVVTILESASMIEAARLIRRHAVKRLPVTDDDGKLVGFLSADDLVYEFAQDLRWLADGIRTGLSNESDPPEQLLSVFGKE